MEANNRRDFLKKAALAGASAPNGSHTTGR